MSNKNANNTAQDKVFEQYLNLKGFYYGNLFEIKVKPNTYDAQEPDEYEAVISVPIGKGDNAVPIEFRVAVKKSKELMLLQKHMQAINAEGVHAGINFSCYGMKLFPYIKQQGPNEGDPGVIVYTNFSIISKLTIGDEVLYQMKKRDEKSNDNEDFSEATAASLDKAS